MEKNSKAKKTDKQTDEKEFFIPRLTIGFALIFFLIGGIVHYCYRNTLEHCTAEVYGTVVYVGRGSIKYSDPVEDKYCYSKRWVKISVDTDSRFTYLHLHANREGKKEGDRVVIHYDPEKPEKYYIDDYADRYMQTAKLFYILCGINIVLSVFLTIYYNIPQKEKKQKPKAKKR